MRILVSFLLVLAALAAPVSAADTNRPNIVVFIADDHSQLDSQAYGSAEVRTPNMAKLAAEGLRFTHAFVASPACGPSRTALLTGLWPARNGAEPNHKPKNPGVSSLPPVLRASGYEVAVIGKVAHNNYAKDHGFDSIEGPNIGFDNTAAVAKFLATRESSKPLCLLVGTRHPHVPWSTERTYEPGAVKIPPSHFDTADTREERPAYLRVCTESQRERRAARILTAAMRMKVSEESVRYS